MTSTVRVRSFTITRPFETFVYIESKVVQCEKGQHILPL